MSKPKIVIHNHYSKPARDAVQKPKYTIGSRVNAPDAGTWTGGKQIPHEKMIVEGYGEKNGELIYDLKVHYSPETVKKYNGAVSAVEHQWAYASDIR